VLGNSKPPLPFWRARRACRARNTGIPNQSPLPRRQVIFLYKALGRRVFSRERLILRVHARRMSLSLLRFFLEQDTVVPTIQAASSLCPVCQAIFHWNVPGPLARRPLGEVLERHIRSSPLPLKKTLFAGFCLCPGERGVFFALETNAEYLRNRRDSLSLHISLVGLLRDGLIPEIWRRSFFFYNSRRFLSERGIKPLPDLPGKPLPFLHREFPCS